MPETFHVVTAALPPVTDPDGATPVCEVSFTCTAPADADCRTYPDCECEVFCWDPERPGYDASGHRRRPGRDCWIRDWFDNDAASYTGEDAGLASGLIGDSDRPTEPNAGPITVMFCGDYVEWDWASPYAHADTGSGGHGA